jgi:predicted DNA binding protein
VPKEARFTYQHNGCWLQETTARHPSIVLVASALYVVGDDVYGNVAVHGPPAIVSAIEREWRADSRLHKVQVVQAGHGSTLFHIGYRSNHSIVRHVLEHTPVSVGPTRHAQGVEYHQVIGEPSDLQALLRTLGERGTLQLTALRDIGEPERDVAAPLQGLTPSESEALLTAYLGGYFRWPRERTADELAADLGLSHTAFLNRLRQAESKIVERTMQDLARVEPGVLEAARTRQAARNRSPGPLQRRGI